MDPVNGEVRVEGPAGLRATIRGTDVINIIILAIGLAALVYVSLSGFSSLGKDVVATREAQAQALASFKETLDRHEKQAVILSEQHQEQLEVMAYILSLSDHERQRLQLPVPSWILRHRIEQRR